MKVTVTEFSTRVAAQFGPYFINPNDVVDVSYFTDARYDHVSLFLGWTITVWDDSVRSLG